MHPPRSKSRFAGVWRLMSERWTMLGDKRGPVSKAMNLKVVHARDGLLAQASDVKRPA